MASQFQLKDRVRNHQHQEEGIVIETAVRIGVGNVYRVNWKGLPEEKNYTWHTEDELIHASVVQDVLQSFAPNDPEVQSRLSQWAQIATRKKDGNCGNRGPDGST